MTVYAPEALAVHRALHALGVSLVPEIFFGREAYYYSALPEEGRFVFHPVHGARAVHADPLPGLLDALLADAERLGVEPEDLDDDVHDAVSALGTEANNGGLPDQLAVLVERCGEAGTRAMLREIGEEKRAARGMEDAIPAGREA